MLNHLYSYDLNYVEPIGLESNTHYVVSGCNLKDANGMDYDYTRILMCVQGLVNRNYPKHHVAISVHLNNADRFWHNYITEEGATFHGMKEVIISDVDQMLDILLPFLRHYGLIVWDEEVPATANIASTICGLDNLIPIRGTADKQSVFHRLAVEKEVPIKMDLRGLFEGAAIGQKINGATIDSTGSTKCDAYLWALDRYFDRCNPELMAYTLDGATSVPDNPVRLANPHQCYDSRVTGIYNHDYFIARQMFFVDLTPYGGEKPNDDPNQPLGADARTMQAILMRRYMRAGGKYGIFVGFPPWHVKYTRSSDKKAHLQPPRLEWMFVELCTSHNMGIEADAPHPCWMSNGSLYMNYVRRFLPKGNNKTRAKDVQYDKDTHYYTFVVSGDFDCSPWMKERVPEVWTDSRLGEYPIAHGYNPNLIERIPMVFDYVFQHQTENDYILGGEGVGYIIPEALHEGFVGKEAHPDPAIPAGYPLNTSAYCVHRSLPSGVKSYVEYSKPYYDELKIDALDRMICGFSYLSPESMAYYNELTPGGTFMENWSAGPYDVQSYGNTLYFRTILGLRMKEKTYDAYAEALFNAFNGDRFGETDVNHQFLALPHFNNGLNYGTPTAVANTVEAFQKYVAEHDPNGKYEYVDVYKFIELVKKSNIVHKRDEN